MKLSSGSNGWQRQTAMATFCSGPAFSSGGDDERDATVTAAPRVRQPRNGTLGKRTHRRRTREEDDETQEKLPITASLCYGPVV
ncbi:hypothetical protein EYF80_021687 [Liparis tanakae]|uniref:Uncharacterized protein n=1 Tax=Liparis tanakae TaxID=230148 RepID=A0A4Z2HT67_9TELE|nr:hypothetical protein EYF80_021687 [Liparis tanakae]